MGEPHRLYGLLEGPGHSEDTREALLSVGNNCFNEANKRAHLYKYQAQGSQASNVLTTPGYLSHTPGIPTPRLLPILDQPALWRRNSGQGLVRWGEGNMEKKMHVVCIRLNLKALTEFKGNVRYNKCTLRPLPSPATCEQNYRCWRPEPALSILALRPPGSLPLCSV